MPHQRFQRFLSGFFTTKPHSEADQAGAKYIIRTDACAFTCSAKLGVSTLVTTRLIPYINQTCIEGIAIRTTYSHYDE